MADKNSLHILIATNNKFKINEMKWFLSDLENCVFHELSEINNAPDVEEDGETLEENANKKAQQISQLTDWIVFTSDVGVELPGLGDKWDYRRPRRILGEHATEAQKARKLIEMMKELHGKDRKAYYPLALSFAKNGKILWSKEFSSYTGYITEEPDFEDIGPNKGMGRLWYIPEFNQTEDRLSEDQHNKLRIEFQTEVKKEIELFIHNL